jgi:hypothetical protein
VAAGNDDGVVATVGVVGPLPVVAAGGWDVEGAAVGGSLLRQADNKQTAATRNPPTRRPPASVATCRC